jgi:hypothetical protein
MDRDKSDFVRVGALIGRPAVVDPAKPNTLGGATPIKREDSQDYPLYRVQKECRFCERAYLRLSPVPQYDSDPVQNGWCGCLRGVSGGEGRWSRHTARPHLAGSALARRVRDPLLDD